MTRARPTDRALMAYPGVGPVVMGILNITPDSFSDGGRWVSEERALDHARDMLAEGAHLIDIGGESTRPGATRPATEEELRRVLPVVSALAHEGAVISIDTMRASVAEAAVSAGAMLVNDVSGGLADPAMVPFVAASGVRYIAMHWRGHSADMQSRAVYTDVVADVRAELSARVDALLAAGVRPEQIVLDPGIGFAKNAGHNWQLLARLDELVALGFPVLVGTSRKAFLGQLEARWDGTPAPPEDRDLATAATSLICADAGVWGLRVHDVAGTVSALRVAAAVRAARDGGAPDGGAPDGRAPGAGAS